MDLDDANNHEIEIFEPTLWKNSLLLASFSWFSTVTMMPKTLSEEFGTKHYGDVCFIYPSPLSLFINS
jgi:hypothetical protein